MHHPERSHIDPETGNLIWSGELEITPGNHSHMPARNASYPSADYERGHNNATSLGGANTRSNVAAQHRDVNHGGVLAVENGERTALQSGARIDSTKTVIVNGDCTKTPEAFLVSDTITYLSGQVQSVHNSFANASYSEQAEWNATISSLPDSGELPNPGDGLRESMFPASYAELMEATDAQLPGIEADYAPTDAVSLPAAEIDAAEAESGAAPGASDADTDAESDAQADADADAESDAQADADADPD